MAFFDCSLSSQPCVSVPLQFTEEGGTAGFAPTVYFPFPTLYSLTHMHYANFFELRDDAAILMSNNINHMMFFELHRVSM